jgi:fructose-1,6-bisphosphatase I
MASNNNGDAGAVGKDSINTDIVTLTRYLTEEQAKYNQATGDFTYVKQQRPGANTV